MSLVTRIMLNYLDTRALSILYVFSPRYLKTEIRNILGPSIISILDEQSSHVDIILHDKTLTINSRTSQDKLIAFLNHEKKEIQVSTLNCTTYLDNIIPFLICLHESIIEVLGEYYKVKRAEEVQISTPNIINMTLFSKTRIALPRNIMEQVEMDHIGTIAAFQNEFIVL